MDVQCAPMLWPMPLSYPGIIMKLCVGIVLASLVLPVSALPRNFTDGEASFLPPYCIDTEYFKGGSRHSNHMSPRAPYWESLMGDGFWWMHHYCSGMVFARRAEAYSKSSPDRGYNYLEAVQEFRYTINQLAKDFVLLPEIYTRLGEVEAKLRDFGAAYGSYLRAREIKPDYWPAYAQWAQVLIDSGQKAEAKKLVQAGLEYSPDAAKLIEQFKLLGGDPTKIVPVVQTTTAADKLQKTEVEKDAAATPPAPKEPK